MWKNTLTVALRSLRRRKGFALLNGFGLALGLAVCAVVLLFARAELGYEAMHPDAGRTALLLRSTTREGETNTSAVTPAPAGPLLADAVPEIDAFVRVRKLWQPRVRRGEAVFYEEGLHYADASVFGVFNFPLAAGDAKTALAEPFTIVLDRPLAARYFGDAAPADVVGEVVELGGRPYRVTGVMEPVPPETAFRPRALVSIATVPAVEGEGHELDSFDVDAYATYLRFHPDADADAALAKATSALAAPLAGTHLEGARFAAQPLERIHLYGRTPAGFGAGGGALDRSPVVRLRLFAGVAGLILLLACVNYVNLATARAGERAREVGVRKSLGAPRGGIARGFLIEAVVLAGAAGVAGLVLAALALPAFNAAVETELSLRMGRDAGFVLGFLALALGVGVLAGLYPALVLSRATPVKALRGGAVGGVGGVGLRRGLVVFQFAAAVALVACAAVMVRQLSFMQSRDLGFQPEQVLAVELRDSPVRTRPDALRAAIEREPAVRGVALGSAFPGEQDYAMFYLHADGVEETVAMTHYAVDAGYLDLLGMRVVAGANLPDPESPAAGRATLLNEAAVRALGWTEPVGKTVMMGTKPLEVVGVVRDFHYASLREAVEPAFMVAATEAFPPGVVLVRFRAGETRAALAAVERAWADQAAGFPLVATFLDEGFGRLYRQERRMTGLFGAFGAIGLVVACLGLLGLAAHATERRTKEIGIRKVLGARAAGIVLLLGREFVGLVAVSALVAAPAAYLAMRAWLEAFAVRAPLGPGLFVLVGLGAVLVALAAVSAQTLRAATADPVRALRSE